MSLHILRVVVRGEFADLAPDVADDLRRRADDHDIFRSAHTKAGTFTYEPRLHAFSFRFERRVNDDDLDGGATVADVASAEAEALAIEYLTERSIGFKRLRSNVVDMADMWRTDS